MVGLEWYLCCRLKHSCDLFILPQMFVSSAYNVHDNHLLSKYHVWYILTSWRQNYFF